MKIALVEGTLGSINKKRLSCLADLVAKGVRAVWVNPLKKENLCLKSFLQIVLNNVL